MENFADRLLSAIDEKMSPIVVGLDPRLAQIPEHIKARSLRCYGSGLRATIDAMVDFNTQIIDAIADIIPAVKPQMAFYEQFGSAGVEAYERTVEHARSRGLLVIGDGKRNDIGSTAQAYADGHLGRVQVLGKNEPVAMFDTDALTVNGYLGRDGIAPFSKICCEQGKGIFVLVRTSNDSAGDLQDLSIMISKDKVYEIMGMLVSNMGAAYVGERGYSSLGAVVGATYPEEAAKLRLLMPKSLFLVPGYGAQGGGADDVVPCFNDDGYGAIVNSSRGIIFAYQKGPESAKYEPAQFAHASLDAVIRMRDDINSALLKVDKCPNYLR